MYTVLYVLGTKLYCVRYVYAPVHIRLRHVIGGGNSGNSIQSSGRLRRKIDEYNLTVSIRQTFLSKKFAKTYIPYNSSICIRDAFSFLQFS